jgi:hypothetical protein
MHIHRNRPESAAFPFRRYTYTVADIRELVKNSWGSRYISASLWGCVTRRSSSGTVTDRTPVKPLLLMTDFSMICSGSAGESTVRGREPSIDIWGIYRRSMIFQTDRLSASSRCRACLHSNWNRAISDGCRGELKISHICKSFISGNPVPVQTYPGEKESPCTRVDIGNSPYCNRF